MPFKWMNIHSATVFVFAYVRVLFFDFLFLFQSVRNLLIRRETRNDQTVLFYQTNFFGVIIKVRRCYIQQNTTQNVLKMVGFFKFWFQPVRILLCRKKKFSDLFLLRHTHLLV